MISKSAISLASFPVFHARFKHTEIDFHFIREKILQRLLCVRLIPSEAQQADILTKVSSLPKFATFWSKFRLISVLNLRGYDRASVTEN